MICSQSHKLYITPLLIKNKDTRKIESKWMELVKILSEIAQTDKDTHGVYSLLSRY